MGTELYTFKARATGIPKKDIIGKADPYLVLRTPMYVSGDSRIKDKTDGRKRVFNATTTAASIAAGLSVTTAAVFASSLAMALAPVVAGAAVVFAIKYASKLHPAKEGYHEIFVSERKRNTFTPDWCPFQLGISEPFKDSEILFECWDWDRAKPSDYVGSVSIPVYELLNSPYERPYQLLDRKGRPAGTLFISCNRSEATPHVVTPHDDEQLNYIPANAYASTNYAAAPCRADSGYGPCGYDASATPAWGLDSSTQSLSSSGYSSEWTSGYDSLNSSRSLASSGYGNDWTGGYDSLNSSQSSGYGNYDPNAQYATSSGYPQYDASAQYDANGQYGASSGYGSSYDASQSPNLWGSSGYDPAASPAWGNAYAGCKDVGYAPSPPMYGGYAAQ